MDEREKALLKAACLRAAATLLGPIQRPVDRPFVAGRQQLAPNTAECVEYARDLFGKLTNESWD